MTRMHRLVRGVGALGILTALVVGIPWALWHFIGWPLPHGVPTWNQIHRGLDQHGIPDQVLVKALAAVVWITWAVLVISVVVEVPAALAGRTAPQIRVVGLFQPLTGRLLAAVIFAVLALAPRAGQTTSQGSLAGLSPHGAGRPLPTLVVNARLADASWSAVAPTTPAPLIESAEAVPAAAPTATSPSAPTAPTTTYVVQRGDTLWGIAEHQLGNPLRWSEILQLNAGRSQPGGRELTDPHWIDPGWTLLLPGESGAADSVSSPTTVVPSCGPAVASPTRSTVPTVTPTAPVAGTNRSGSVPQSATTPSVSVPSSTQSHPTPEVQPATSGPLTARLATSSADPVQLPSGSVIGASFVAGLFSAMALGHLRRRHAYRYSTPQAGVDLVPDPTGPTLRRLVSDQSAVAEHLDADADTDESGPVVIPNVVNFDPGDRQDPGRIDFGVRDGTTVSIEVAEISGVAFSGPETDNVARALIGALLVHAGPGAAEFAMTASLSERLLPRVPVSRAIRQTHDTDGVARLLEAEVIARTRRLDAVEAPDAQTFRAQSPENPLPLLLALVDGVPDESVGRWTAMLGGLPRLGIAVVFLASNDAALGHLVLDFDRYVSIGGRPGLGVLNGVEAFGLDADEAVELLGAFAESHRECEAEEPSFERDLACRAWALTPSGQSEDEVAGDEVSLPISGEDHYDEEPAATAIPLAQQWPAVAPAAEDIPRAITVHLFGPYGITAYGQPVETGLRRRSKMLLAWFMLRPNGATPEEAVDALWPETSPEDTHKVFWRALGELRSRLSDTERESIEVLSRIGEHYVPAAADIQCDLWTFQNALVEAARATDDEGASSALRRATDAYTGDLLVGSDYPWVEPIRRDLHRRCLDALLRLAEIEEQSGHPDSAEAILERAIDLDLYAEEPYRRLMSLHAVRNRPGSVTTTWQLLNGRLGDLDLEVEETTSHLFHSLTRADTNVASIRHPARAS